MQLQYLLTKLACEPAHPCSSNPRCSRSTVNNLPRIRTAVEGQSQATAPISSETCAPACAGVPVLGAVPRPALSTQVRGLLSLCSEKGQLPPCYSFLPAREEMRPAQCGALVLLSLQLCPLPSPATCSFSAHLKGNL